MPATLSPGARRLEAISQRDEHLRPYAELLGLTLEAIGRDRPVYVGVSLPNAHGPAQDGPILAGTALGLERAAVRGLFETLAERAGLAGGPVSDADLLGLMSSTIRMDPDSSSEGPLATVLGLTSYALLHAARQQLLPSGEAIAWNHGGCPLCGAWPALAESRGLDRSRVMRCGRCSSSWTLQWQLCPFCRNDDHATLSYLYSQGLGDARKVFACERCRGYLKTLATVTPLEPEIVPVEDLATLELDLAALDQGFQKPDPTPLQASLQWNGE